MSAQEIFIEFKKEVFNSGGEEVEIGNSSEMETFELIVGLAG